MTTFDHDAIELGSRVRVCLRFENDATPDERVRVIAWRAMTIKDVVEMLEKRPEAIR